jgi:hypothetical protein
LDIKSQIKTLAFLVLLLSFFSSNAWSTLPIGNDFFWWIIQIVFIYILINFRNKTINISSENNLDFINYFLVWAAICIVRGAFTADHYWEWKFLIANGFVLLMPLVVFLTISLKTVQYIVHIWFKYALFIFLGITPFIHHDAIGKFLMPFTFLIIFFFILNQKWKIIVLIFSVYVITYDLSARSNVVKFIVPFIIIFICYFKNILQDKILKTVRLLLMSVPVLLLFLGISGIFNIFKIDEFLGEQTVKTKSISGEKGEESLTSDSRTGLYVEVIESAIKNNYVLWGRTPARGNDSSSFGDYNKEVLRTGKAERFSNEVSILNIFTWLGLVGVVLYFLIFLKSSYLAINQSNNILIKLVGLNVSFRWAYAFLEDFSVFDLSNFFLWIMIGMCFSRSFRQMTDNQMKDWVLGIFKSPNRFKTQTKTVHLLNLK